MMVVGLSSNIGGSTGRPAWGPRRGVSRFKTDLDFTSSSLARSEAAILITCEVTRRAQAPPYAQRCIAPTSWGCGRIPDQLALLSRCSSTWGPLSVSSRAVLRRRSRHILTESRVDDVPLSCSRTAPSYIRRIVQPFGVFHEALARLRSE